MLSVTLGDRVIQQTHSNTPSWCLGSGHLKKDDSPFWKRSEFSLNFDCTCKKNLGLLLKVMGAAAYTVHVAVTVHCDCLLILILRSALLEKMPVMESKLSTEPVTNGEVPSQPEVETKQGTLSTCCSCVCVWVH